MKLTLSIAGIILLSLIFLICAFGVFVASTGVMNNSDLPTASGKVIDRRVHHPVSRYGSSYDVYTKYAVNGSEYTCKDIDLPVTNDYIGDSVEIEYEPGDPSNCHLKPSSADNAFYLGFAGVLSLVFIGFIVRGLIRS